MKSWELHTELILEAPAGLVRVRAVCADGKVEKVTIQNVPSFADQLDARLEIAGVGTITVDTAYGGDSFVLVDARSLGFALTRDEARDIAVLGAKVTKATNEQLRFDAGGRSGLSAVSFCQMTAPLEQLEGKQSGLSVVVIRPGKLDRSPCGTGCSARMAVLHRRGILKTGDRFIGRSMLGSRFDCRIDSEVDVKGDRGIIPIITGSAWITGVHQHMLDPADPWPHGYRMADTWPNARP